MEQHPSEAPPGASVRLAEFAAVQSILMRASIEAQARRAGWDPSTPIGEFIDRAPAARAGEPPRYRCHLGCILLKIAAISLLTGGAACEHRVRAGAGERTSLAVDCYAAPLGPAAA